MVAGFLVGGGLTQQVIPSTLTAALAAAPSGATLILEDGLYTVATDNGNPLNLGVAGGPLTIKAKAGARPIITNNDGTPPRLVVKSNTTVRGLWFGGTTDPTEKPITVESDCILEDCVFFGYYECIDQSGLRNRYSRNRYLNCGNGSLYHDMYITTADDPAHPTIIEDQIHINGSGYKTQLWHSPVGVTLRRNFYAHGYELSINGVGHVVQDCVFWNNAAQALVDSWLTVDLGTPANYQFLHNCFGPETFGTTLWSYQMNGATGRVVDRCGFIGALHTDTTTWPGHSIKIGPYDPTTNRDSGTNPVIVADAANTASVLGVSAATIDAAIAALEASFAASVATIHADGTIETNFALLAGVATTWAAQP